MSTEFAQMGLPQETPMMVDFITRLKSAARRAGYPDTQSSIARALGCPRATVHKWFHLGRKPSLEMLERMADKFGVSREWLATGEGDREPVSRLDDLHPEEREVIRAIRRAVMSSIMRRRR